MGISALGLPGHVTGPEGSGVSWLHSKRCFFCSGHCPHFPSHCQSPPSPLPDPACPLYCLLPTFHDTVLSLAYVCKAWALCWNYSLHTPQEPLIPKGCGPGSLLGRAHPASVPKLFPQTTSIPHNIVSFNPPMYALPIGR